MNQKDLSELSDQELLSKAKEMKRSAILSAFTIGLMFGVILWSVVKSTVGFFTLVPLFFIYKMINSTEKTEENEALKKIMKERNLK